MIRRKNDVRVRPVENAQGGEGTVTFMIGCFRRRQQDMVECSRSWLSHRERL